MQYIYNSKSLYIAAIFVLCALFFSPQAKAQQDTLVVEWWDDDAGEVIVNALRDAILTDTDRPPGRVYKLQRGGYYWITDRIENSGYHLRIVGETPGNTIQTAPAVIQRVWPVEGDIDTRIITGLNDVTLKNLWIAGADDEGVQTAYQPLQMDASNRTYVFDNVVFERSNFAIPAFTGTNNTIKFTNCVFRNLVGKPSDQQWQGRGISVWANQDTVIIENNTFFNINMTAFQLEGGAGSYVRFNQNTLVYIGRGITSGGWWRTAYFTNNLIINGFWHGEGPADLADPNRQPGAYHAGMFAIGTLPTIYGPAEGRRIVFGNNYSWREQAYYDYYGPAGARAQPFISTLSQQHFDNYDQIIAVDTVWLSNRPNFGNYPNGDLIQRQIQNITDLRDGSGDATQHFWNLPTLPGTDELHHTAISWPLPEDFSYTDENLLNAGVGGYPIGDLNWFPDRKADWEANKDAQIEAIHAMGGDEVIITVEGTAEAEHGELGGEAEIVDFGGALPYFRMEGGGFIRWTFEMAEPATIELVITTRSQDARRGQHVRLNGTGLRNYEGSGEYSWFDLDPTEWKDYHINQDTLYEGASALELAAGESTLEIAPSWGWQEFQQVQVLVNGNVVHTLNASNAEYEIVELISPVVVPHFRMEGAGFMRWDFEMDEAQTVDLIITTRSQDARRGQHVRVNNVGLQNDAGFGEYSWYDLHPEEWKDYRITKDDLVQGASALDLDAGTNTIEIAHSWGWQEFLMVQVVVGDDVLHELTSLNVTEFEIVQVISEGGPPTSNFQSVDLKGGGTITWRFNVPETGTYALNVLYQAPLGSRSGQILVNNANVARIDFPGEEDDLTIHAQMSGVFTLSAGEQDITLSGSEVIIDLVQLLKTQGITSVPPDKNIADRFLLYQNYPNPFNPATTIRYTIPNTEKVVLKIYNVLGQEIKTLVNEVQLAGTYQISFDASNLASGMYIYRIQAGSFTDVRRMMFIK